MPDLIGIFLPALALAINAGATAPHSSRRAVDPDVLLGRAALSVLVQAARHDDGAARAAAADAWGKIGNPAAIPLLKTMLKDKNRFVRLEAAGSLYRLGDKNAFGIVAKFAQSAPTLPKNQNPIEQLKMMAQERLRVAAIHKLCAIGKPNPPIGEKVVKIFESTINDPYGPVRDATAVSLAAMGLDEFEPRFLDAAKNDDPSVRAEAIRALGDIGTANALGAVSAAASDAAPGVRVACMAALAHFPAADAAALLIAGAKDADARVRMKALESLSGIRYLQAVPVLQKAFDQAPDLSTRIIAAAGLLRNGQKVDASSISEALKSEDDDIRRLAVEALGLDADPAAANLLKSVMEKDGSSFLRVSAAEILVRRLARKSGRHP
ncbi:MAG: HEAT repeat domain-containing protein [Elusimicrobiota bacterium]